MNQKNTALNSVFADMRSIMGEATADVSQLAPKGKDKDTRDPQTARTDLSGIHDLVKKFEVHVTELDKSIKALQEKVKIAVREHPGDEAMSTAGQNVDRVAAAVSRAQLAKHLTELHAVTSAVDAAQQRKRLATAPKQ